MDLSTRQGRREQGQRIQQAVERAGLSIEELAGRVGCSRALIYQYLSGSTLAQPDRLQQIASQCGVPLTFFYSEAPDTEPATAPTSSLAASLSAPPLAESSTTEVSETPTAPAPVTPAPQEVTARLSDSLRALQELAQAQEGPPDYRAMASTCERILSLAAQVGDRDSQSLAQMDLGIALNKIGDFPRAADALNRAVTLAAEIGNLRREMSARQSLGRALTMMGRTEQARVQFQRIADEGGFDSRWRGLLSLGSLHEQQGEYQQAMQRFDEAAILLEDGEANRLADRQAIGIGLLYVNTNRRTVYLAEGDLNEARRLAEKCLADAEALGSADQNLEARLDLGWCDLYMGRWEQALTGLTATLQLTRFVGDARRETAARAILGILMAGAGDFDTASAHGKDALSLALSHGDRPSELYAQLALADAYTGPGGRATEARYHANQALSVTTSARFTRWEIECLLRVARVSAQAGDREALREAAVRARRLAESMGARHLESLARVWLAETLLFEVPLSAIQFEVQKDIRVEIQGESQLGMETDSGSSSQGATPGALEQAHREAAAALELAQTTGFVESLWRARDVLARIALAEGSLQEAETNLRAAIVTLEGLRAQLLAAGVPDTLLENADCLDVYAHLVTLLNRNDRRTEAAAFLEQTGWPPLAARIADL